MVNGCGTFCPPTAIVGGACGGSPGICGCGGGAGCVRQSPPGAVPAEHRQVARRGRVIVGAIDPPPAGNGRTPSHGYRRSIAGGWLVAASLPSKQSPPCDGRPQCEVGLAAASHDVAPDDVVRGHPQVAVEDRHHDHAVGRGVLDDVVRDKVVAATRHGDAHPERGVRERLRRCVRVAVVVDVVAGDHRVALRRPELAVQRVGNDPGEVVVPVAVHDREVAAGVRAGEPRGVVGRLHVGDHGVARVASARWRSRSRGARSRRNGRSVRRPSRRRRSRSRRRRTRSGTSRCSRGRRSTRSR